MKENKIIERKTVDENPYGFARLREEGIEFAQNLSGLEWTDYNHHDPGVTILEQICFALTDLIYRSNFDVTDYLCDERGKINTSELGLHAPQDVFFTRPTSEIDYRKALIDMSDNVSDVRFLTENSLMPSEYGLYKLKLRRSQTKGSSFSDNELIEQTYKNFNSMRNLCEDIEDIQVINEIDCYLEIDFTLKAGFQPESVLAEVYLLASKELAMEASYTSYSRGLEHGMSLDDIMSGPFTKNGILSDDEILNASVEKDKSLLESTILASTQKVIGIEYVTYLRLRDAGAENNPEGRLRLIDPISSEQLSSIYIKVAGKQINVSFEEFKINFDKHKLIKESQTYNLDEDIYLSKPIMGNYRSLNIYQSVQNQFPATYGINQLGIPENYPEERKAQALQLKSYLLLFEQIMSNYLVNLNSISRLFSIDTTTESTYFSGILDKDEISSLQKIYPENAKELLEDILIKVDDFFGRKNRLLDYLLALYGEDLNHEQCRIFNYYFTANELEREIVLNKVRLINNIQSASGDRGSAETTVNMRLRIENSLGNNEGKIENSISISGLQYRVGLFLGFKRLRSRSLIQIIFDHDLCIIPHDSFVKEYAALDSEDYIISNEEIHLAKKLFPKEVFNESDERYYRIARNMYKIIEPMRNNFLSTALIECGVNVNNYIYDKKNRSLSLSLKSYSKASNEKGRLELLSSIEEADAAKFSKFLRRLLIHISIESEGMHIVEHILLRPKDLKKIPVSLKKFFANRVSVIFPAWTARCCDPDFRAWAEELVRENCPAHIRPDIYWLDFKSMCEFEVMYNNWCELIRVKRTYNKSDALDQYSLTLIRFLVSKKFDLAYPDDEVFQKEIESNIKSRGMNYSNVLLSRHEELVNCPRRNQDIEELYLQEIELFQAEIQRMKVYLVEHVRLLPRNSHVDESWDSYISSVSVILPKISSFRRKSTGKTYFQAFRSVVESELREKLDSSVTIECHWLIPFDFETFVSLYSNWNTLRNNSVASNVALGVATNRLETYLKLLKKSSDITNNISNWKSVQSSVNDV